MPISDEQKSRITSAIIPALGAFVIPSPSILSDIAAIEAIDARKMQTRHGARGGGTLGMYASIPLLAYAIKKGKLNLRGAKNIYKTYAKNVALPIGVGTGLGAYVWHGPPGVSREQKQILEDIKAQLIREGDIRGARAMENEKTSEAPTLIDKAVVALATPASTLMPGVPIGTGTATLLAPKGKKMKAVGGYTTGRYSGMIPGYAAAAYLGRSYIRNPKKIKTKLGEHSKKVDRFMGKVPAGKKPLKFVGLHAKKIKNSPVFRKVAPLLVVGEAVGGATGFSISTAEKNRRGKKRKAMVKTSALPNLLKVIKIAKEQKVPVDPVKERALKKISAGIKNKKNVQRS